MRTLKKLPPVLIYQGTEDVAMPIFYSMYKKNIPVYYLAHHMDYLASTIPKNNLIMVISENSNESIINSILRRVGFEGKPIIVFPTNEVSLNRSFFLSSYKKGTIFHIPGTFSYPKKMNAFEITNKEKLYKGVSNLLNNIKINNFKTVKTFVIKNKEDLIKLSPKNIYPVIIKPSAKDYSDSFTHKFGSKLLVANNYEELLTLFNKMGNVFDYSFILQEKIDFEEEYSVCGMRSKDHYLTAVIRPLIKLPSIGGTGVFTKIVAKPEIDEIAKKILSRLDFEGIFEIEFFIKNNIIYFFYEFNPRAWLQVDNILSTDLDIFTIYYYLVNNIKINIEEILKKQKQSKSNVFWSSVNRYFKLSSKPRFRDILQMINYDVSIKYKNKNRLFEKVKAIKYYIKKYVKKR